MYVVITFTSGTVKPFIHSLVYSGLTLVSVEQCAHVGSAKIFQLQRPSSANVLDRVLFVETNKSIYVYVNMTHVYVCTAVF